VSFARNHLPLRRHQARSVPCGYPEESCHVDCSRFQRPFKRSGRRGEFTGYLIKLTVISTLGGLLFGYDTGVISGALPFLKADLKLSDVQEASVVSSLLFGAMIGALIGGKLSDVLGRKGALRVCAIVFFLGALGSALAPSFGVMLPARIVLGIAVGCSGSVLAWPSFSRRPGSTP
jgi:hypothetical protein